MRRRRRHRRRRSLLVAKQQIGSLPLSAFPTTPYPRVRSVRFWPLHNPLGDPQLPLSSFQPHARTPHCRSTNSTHRRARPGKSAPPCIRRSFELAELTGGPEHRCSSRRASPRVGRARAPSASLSPPAAPGGEEQHSWQEDEFPRRGRGISSSSSSRCVCRANPEKAVQAEDEGGRARRPSQAGGAKKKESVCPRLQTLTSKILPQNTNAHLHAITQARCRTRVAAQAGPDLYLPLPLDVVAEGAEVRSDRLLSRADVERRRRRRKTDNGPKNRAGV